MGSEVTGDSEGEFVGSEVAGDEEGEFVGSELTGDEDGVLVGSEETGVKLGELVGSDETGDALGELVGFDVTGEELGIAVGFDVTGELVVGAKLIGDTVVGFNVVGFNVALSFEDNDGELVGENDGKGDGKVVLGGNVGLTVGEVLLVDGDIVGSFGVSLWLLVSSFLFLPFFKHSFLFNHSKLQHSFNVLNRFA